MGFGMVFDVKLYFSGSVEDEVNEYLIQNNVHRLSTFAYPKEALTYLNLADKLGLRTRMLIDSGAFTSWSVGKPVQLENLIAYNDKLLSAYGARHDFIFISLDVIPGTRSTRPTSEDINKAVKQSYDNFLVMQQHFKGYEVLPVYHSGEDPGLRDAYLQLTDYICLSMDQNMHESARLAWAQRASIPGYRYHGLAATGNNMVTQVGWYSVDSSSWVTVAAMGSILWASNGRFRTLAVSSTSPSRHLAGQHLTTLSQSERAAVEAKIRGLGFDPELMATSHNERWRWNVYNWCNPPWKSKVTKPMDLFS